MSRADGVARLSVLFLIEFFGPDRVACALRRRRRIGAEPRLVSGLRDEFFRKIISESIGQAVRILIPDLLNMIVVRRGNKDAARFDALGQARRRAIKE